MNGITFLLDLDSGEKLYIHVKNMGETIAFSKSPNKNGMTLNPNEISDLFEDSSVKRFFDEVLGLNLSTNAAFRQAYRELTKQETGDIFPYVNDMLSLSSHIFFNRYFA
jgi:hypothetical protein